MPAGSVSRSRSHKAMAFAQIRSIGPRAEGEPSSCVPAPWGAVVVSSNDRVTFRADLTVCARKHTDKSGLLKMGDAPNSAEIQYFTVAPGPHNAEVEGSSPFLTTKINEL